jgi:hypothetical protein
MRMLLFELGTFLVFGLGLGLAHLWMIKSDHGEGGHELSVLAQFTVVGLVGGALGRIVDADWAQMTGGYHWFATLTAAVASLGMLIVHEKRATHPLEPQSH